MIAISLTGAGAKKKENTKRNDMFYYFRVTVLIFYNGQNVGNGTYITSLVYITS